jgi:hypothetical protein
MGPQLRGSDAERAPICPDCGVTALLEERGRAFEPRFVCENPDCEAFGDVVSVDE